MKRIFTIVTLLAAAAFLTSCKGGDTRKVLLPNVSGKAGEVIVVMDKSNWEGTTGNDIRELLASDCPWLAQREPLYSLVKVDPSGFADLFKVHRNIVFFNIDPQTTPIGVFLRNDVWASPQCVIYVAANDSAQADSLVKSNGDVILNAIEQAERDRVIRNTFQYEEKDIAVKVGEVIGGSPHFPYGYKFKKASSDFVWVADEKQYTNQSVFVYKYPAKGTAEDFSEENIIAHRNEILKENVPGMFDGTYMTTSDYIASTVRFVKYRGREFAETRGFWEVYNDFMGGPFVSHSFYSPDGSEVVVAEAFVYAPRYDKRQYLRQVESLLYSFEWKKE